MSVVFKLRTKKCITEYKKLQKQVSESALVVNNNVVHKILNTNKGFLTEKTRWKFICGYTSEPP